MFDRLVKSKSRWAAELLEKLYGCEIKVHDIASDVRFAHHARGCTIIATKISEGVVIMQNVTIGTNMRYHKPTKTWENVGNPIIGKNVVIADGAKILGPVIVGENSVVAAGAIVTKDVPPNSIVFGANRIREKDPDYDLIFNPDMIAVEEIIRINEERIRRYSE